VFINWKKIDVVKMFISPKVINRFGVSPNEISMSFGIEIGKIIKSVKTTKTLNNLEKEKVEGLTLPHFKL
jgi:hypothetical protein